MPDHGLYSAGFFDLQLRFAAKVAELRGGSLADVVGDYTNIYVRLGMGPRLDKSNPDWQRYVDALSRSRGPTELTHRVHRRRARLPAGPKLESTVGCFSYALAGEKLVRLHFHPGEQQGESPLSSANRPVRQSELATLLAQLKGTFGEDLRIVGASWLYNLPSYRRLFPAAYLASLAPIEHPYQRMPLWGQFLHRDRSVRSEVATRFLAAVARAPDIPALRSCFPHSVLATTAPATWFYDHAGL